jgi:flagellar biosynthetic protein FliR
MITSVPYFAIEPGQVQLAMLALVRLSGMVVMAPPFSHPAIRTQVKLAVGGSLALLAWPALQARPLPLAPDVLSLAALAACELTLGLAIGFVARLALAAASVAAEIVSVQMGFGLASLLDPLQGAQVTVLTRVYDWLVLVLFLALDAHHLVIGAVVESFRLVPLGGAALTAEGAMSVVPLGARVFSLALLLVAPVLGVLFIANLVMVLAARAVPQLSLLSVGLPIMIGLGFVVLLANLELMSGVVGREMTGLPELLTALLRGFAGGR